ncbi:MAG: HNH endonuclease [Peptococcaceae bacterium]|jgi:hypothetical protein|nr:HNH endonuclease [Peptococcaceae bacterium]
MPNNKRKSKAHIKQPVLLPPNPEPNTLVDRDEWIEQAAKGFITTSSANRGIYKVILEVLWPKGHGIPGPVIDRESIRNAVDAAKGKPYLDVFRRLRELQGDEGFLGIVKQGNQYQLIDSNIYAKKTPRTHLSNDKWNLIAAHYKNVCAACGSSSGEKGFQQDHKVPRARGGADATSNWQPLCDSCNNIKSVSCRACKDDCSKCGWAYPEFYKPVKLPGSTLRALHKYTDERKLDANKLVSEWILEKINTQ